MPSVAALFDREVPPRMQESRSDREKSGPEHVLNVLATTNP
jgi:hypothetical protein